MDKAPKPHDLKEMLKDRRISKVIEAIKTLILCIMHNPAYPRLLMDVFRSVIPK